MPSSRFGVFDRLAVICDRFVKSRITRKILRSSDERVPLGCYLPALGLAKLDPGSPYIFPVFSLFSTSGSTDSERAIPDLASFSYVTAKADLTVSSSVIESTCLPSACYLPLFQSCKLWPVRIGAFYHPVLLWLVYVFHSLRPRNFSVGIITDY